jgi:glutamyl-tRNA reductase
MNHLVVCGLNYHDTPLAIRERFTIPQSCLGHALTALKNLPHVKEAVLVSTCNRTEVYAVVSNVQAGWREIDSFFASTQAITDHGVLKPNFRLLREDVAVHLFRVASGLDSMILGETQIVSQLKSAHQAALQAGTAGPVLDYLFKTALNCGKRVRTETAMGRRAVSVSSAAVELGRTHLSESTQYTAVVVGGGKMAQICAKILLGEATCDALVMLNRSPERLQNFSENKLPNRERLDISANFADRHEILATADLVIVATSSFAPVITANDLLKARAQSGSKKLCIVDISVPRNVEPAVGELPGVTLHHCDDLMKIVQMNLAEREAVTADAQKIVYETLEDFHSWQRSLLVVPTIAELREKIESIRLEQMAKSRFPSDSAISEEEKEQIEGISRAIVNQILHHPTIQLKATRDYHILRQHAEALRTLFNLDPLSAGSTVLTTRRRHSSLIEH